EPPHLPSRVLRPTYAGCPPYRFAAEQRQSYRSDPATAVSSRSGRRPIALARAFDVRTPGEHASHQARGPEPGRVSQALDEREGEEHERTCSAPPREDGHPRRAPDSDVRSAAVGRRAVGLGSLHDGTLASRGSAVHARNDNVTSVPPPVGLRRPHALP